MSNYNSRMKAAYLETTGPADVIRFGELPTPEPGEGEVLVRVGAAAVNPIDTYIRGGLVAMPLPRPFIPGCDFAGEVAKLGPAVSGLRPGQRVWGSNQGVLGRQGTLAEYACVRQEWIYPTPDGVSDAEAAANALVGITAWLGVVWRANLQAGELILVSGATGGVGAMAVQMARQLGAVVFGTVGSKVELARSLGVQTLIDYRQPLREQIRGALASAGPDRKGVDVWYETQPPSDLETTFDCMAPNGRVVLIAGRSARPVWPNGAFYPKNLSVFGFAMFNVSAEVQRQAAEAMNQWMAAGRLKATIGATFPLSRAAEAHRLQEENTLGKTGTLTGKIIVTPG